MTGLAKIRILKNPIVHLFILKEVVMAKNILKILKMFVLCTHTWKQKHELPSFVNVFIQFINFTRVGVLPTRTRHHSWCPQRPEEVFDPWGLELEWLWATMWSWDSNLCPLEEHAVLLTFGAISPAPTISREGSCLCRAPCPLQAHW